MLADATFAPLLRLPTRLGPRRFFAATWTVIATAAIGLRYLDRALVGDRNDARTIGADVALLVLWALAAPTIMRSARRFPIRGELALRHGTMHLAMASSFILATNIAIRLPMYFAASANGTSTFGAQSGSRARPVRANRAVRLRGDPDDRTRDAT